MLAPYKKNWWTFVHNFAQKQITVRQGKGKKDRMTVLPTVVLPFLQEHLRYVQHIHARDLAGGHGCVELFSQ